MKLNGRVSIFHTFRAMNKRAIVVPVTLLLAACGPAAASPVPTETAPQATVTATLPPQPTSTATPEPTPTDTPTATPYPTFDAAHAVTSTPFPPAECPPEDPNLVIDTSFDPDTMPSDTRFTLIDKAVANGASLSQLHEAFGLELRDLTGDGVKELYYHDLYTLFILGCKEGKTVTLLNYRDDGSWAGGPKILSIQDMNLNGVPEVVTEGLATTGLNTNVNIFEWNGSKFAQLLKAGLGENSRETSAFARTLYWSDIDWYRDAEYYETHPGYFSPSMNGRANITIKDTDANGTKELILKDDGPTHWDSLLNYGPWRGKEVVFKWDGLHFLYSSLEMDPPEYRFQALQDADRFFLMGDYDRALAFYQDVIFDQVLEWWSEERKNYEREIFYYSLGKDPDPTLLPPEQDANEYPTLAAYARYRILLYYLSNGWDEDARVVYDTLQEKYPPGAVGHQYAHIATILWNAYQEQRDPVEACAQVVDYTRMHTEEIVVPLNPWYYGLQSHRYVPEDICPIGFW